MQEEKERTRDPERISLTFSGEALDTLKKIAEHEDKSFDEVVASALGLKQWALEVKDNKDRVVVRHGDKDKYELTV